AEIVATLQAESDLRPDAVGDSGLAFGLAQWHPDPRAVFQGSVAGPCEDRHLRSGSGSPHTNRAKGGEPGAGRVRGAPPQRTIWLDCSQNYERPADRYGKATRRGHRAEQIVNQFTNPEPSR